MLQSKGILTPIQRRCLEVFAQLPDQEQFYLTGGTALAEFFLGHRLSFDIDTTFSLRACSQTPPPAPKPNHYPQFYQPTQEVGFSLSPPWERAGVRGRCSRLWIPPHRVMGAWAT